MRKLVERGWRQVEGMPIEIEKEPKKKNRLFQPFKEDGVSTRNLQLG